MQPAPRIECGARAASRRPYAPPSFAPLRYPKLLTCGKTKAPGPEAAHGLAPVAAGRAAAPGIVPVATAADNASRPRVWPSRIDLVTVRIAA